MERRQQQLYTRSLEIYINISAIQLVEKLTTEYSNKETLVNFDACLEDPRSINSSKQKLKQFVCFPCRMRVASELSNIKITSQNCCRIIRSHSQENDFTDLAQAVIRLS